MVAGKPKAPPRRAAADRPQVEVADRAALRRWLVRHHATSTGAWIVTRKVSRGGSVAWDDLVEEALCFGWIDSLPRKIDDDRTAHLLTPRKPKSKWSVKNQRHVASLEARGLMQPAGHAAVALAKATGTWSALEATTAMIVPDDLAAALAARPSARGHWDGFPPSVRRGLLGWIGEAKRPTTRAARVEEIAREAARGVRANQWRPPKGD